MTRGKAPNFPIRPVLEYYGVEVNARGKALCIWHPDSSPSLSVTEYGFVCWACGKRGDAIKLIRDEEGLSFEDSLARAEAICTGADRPVSREPEGFGWGAGASLLA